jgi:N-acetylglucosaminyldiphosphoundecaprenol N-acetyl-beta-D-mannosaminyltransferase
MRLNAVNILKISVTTNSKKEILEEIRKYLDSPSKNQQKSLKIYTPNAEQLVSASKNHNFATLLNRADIAIPDSVGVVWAGHILTKNGPENQIPGVEFMEDLTAIAAKQHVPIELIGGKGKVAIEAFDCLQKKYPGLTTSDKPGIVFVALGAPKQEEYIDDAAGKTHGIIYMAVGGSFDIISGRLRRAPLVFRKLKLEWFWRLLLEPWRIWRQLALIEFIWLVIREKIAT